MAGIVRSLVTLGEILIKTRGRVENWCPGCHRAVPKEQLDERFRLCAECTARVKREKKEGRHV